MKVDDADRFAEMSMIEKNKTLAKMWRELPKEKKGKITKNFEKVTKRSYMRIIFENMFRQKRNTQPRMKNGCQDSMSISSNFITNYKQLRKPQAPNPWLIVQIWPGIFSPKWMPFQKTNSLIFSP